MAGTVDSALYGALATVAAITTALQAAVGLIPLTDSLVIDRRMESSSPKEAEYEKAKEDAGVRLWTAAFLNVPIVVVNGAVLASWLGLGIVHDSWVLWLPWAAVLGAAVFLIGCAASGSWKLYDRNHKP